MYNIEDLIYEYGNLFLQESNRGDDALYPMDDLELYLPKTSADAFSLGWRSRNQFSFADSYFTFDGYGNIISIPGREYLPYLQNQIEEDEFVDWLISQGFIDEDEDFEDED